MKKWALSLEKPLKNSRQPCSSVWSMLESSAIKIAEDADETSPIIKMLAKDPTDSYESALKDFYRKIRPGEPATLSNARSAIMRLFFDPKRYNLGQSRPL